MKKYVLITGAGSDIGTAVANELSKQYNLVITDIDEESIECVKDSCDTSADIRTISADLMDVDSLEETISQWMSKENICISGFVHCAGIAKRIPLKMVKSEYFLEAFKVNVIAAAEIIKILVSKKNRKALESVVLIASTAAQRGVKTFSVYGASKAAVEGLMRNLAIELAPRVRVNSISPGAVMTKATKPMMDINLDNISAKYPLGIGKPENLSGVISFLMSDKASWVTGQNIVVDGGRSIDGSDQ